MRLLATGRAARAAGRLYSSGAYRYSDTSTSCSTWKCSNRRHSTAPPHSETLKLDGTSYKTDDWTNISPTISSAIPRRLHLQSHHPLSITRRLIEARFPAPTYQHHNSFPPVVSVAQNFDSLGFPLDHPGRSRTDTYYVNKDTVLRTHTSAHQADTFRKNASEGFLISADVYRRDAIDRSHYPVFHQMEGARVWDRSRVPDADIAKAVWADVASLPKHDVQVEDPNPTIHPERNPLQAAHHTADEVETISAHLKRSLELVVVDIFSKARHASPATSTSEPLRIRWVEAYFPFTSPSWELEVFHDGAWLELLGCGVVQQNLLINAGVPAQVGWAFGLGLERIAMLLFGIPDIRLFWSQDERFLSQFSSPMDSSAPFPRFIPFSKHPACYKDVAFWLPSSTVSTSMPTPTQSLSPSGGLSPPPGAGQAFHENDLTELIRDAAGADVVEDVRLVDEFTHPKTQRRSLCYRISYRSLERTLRNEEVNGLHDRVREGLEQRMGVELR